MKSLATIGFVCLTISVVSCSRTEFASGTTAPLAAPASQDMRANPNPLTAPSEVSDRSDAVASADPVSLVVDEPDVPVADEPTVPVADEPTAPVADEPTTPVVVDPVPPVFVGPTPIVVVGPTPIAVVEPTPVVIVEPTLPVIPEPTAPVASNPVIVPVEPVSPTPTPTPTLVSTSGCLNGTMIVDPNATFTFAAGTPDVVDFVISLQSYTNLPASTWNGGNVHADAITATAVCNLKGYAAKYTYTARAYSSCGNNTHVNWNNTLKKFEVKGACVSNAHFDKLVCKGKLAQACVNDKNWVFGHTIP